MIWGTHLSGYLVFSLEGKFELGRLGTSSLVARFTKGDLSLCQLYSTTETLSKLPVIVNRFRETIYV